MNRFSESPIHTQLYDALKDWFIHGFRPGEKLPTEKEIMKRYDVGRGTVRSALNELVREGLIERSPGRGSFLTPDFLISLKRYSIAILLSEKEFSARDSWEYTWHNHVEMLNGAIKESLIKNISLEIIPESAISIKLNDSFDAFICFRYINPAQLHLLSKPLIPFHYELDLAGGLAGVVQHITGSGYTKPAYIGTARSGRIDLINHFLNMKGKPVLKEDFIVECSGTVREGYLACQELLERNVSPDCLICSTDLRALGALSFLKEKGISVPEDMGICGFDGIREAEQSDPSLTTWSFPWQKLGSLAVDEVRALLDGGKVSPYEALKGKLLIRNSTAPQPGAAGKGGGQLPPAAAGQAVLKAYLKGIETESGVEGALEKFYQWSIESGVFNPAVLESRKVEVLYSADLDIEFRCRFGDGQNSFKGESAEKITRIYELNREKGKSCTIQLHPEPLYPRHFLMVQKESGERDPEETALSDALDFLKTAPSYTVCSGEGDGKSGGLQLFPRHDLTLIKARTLKHLHCCEGEVSVEILKYPLPVIRLSGPNRKALVRRGRDILRYGSESDETVVNFLSFREKGLYRICFVFQRKDSRGQMGMLDASGDWLLPHSEESCAELSRNSRSFIEKMYSPFSPEALMNPEKLKELLQGLWKNSIGENI